MQPAPNPSHHNITLALTSVHNDRPYDVETLGGTIITLRKNVFVPDQLTLDFVDFCRQFIATHSAIDHVADLGTGSGVIAVTLANLYTNKNFSAFDISSEALALARHNAQKNGLHNINFVTNKPTQWLPSNYQPPIDLIVSNPPFIGIEEWGSPSLFSKFPDCQRQPLHAMKTTDQYGISEYIAITKAAAKKNVRWIIFRPNGDYIDELIRALNNYSVDITTAYTPNGCPVMILQL